MKHLIMHRRRLAGLGGALAVALLMAAAAGAAPSGIPSTEEMIQRLTTPPDQLPMTMRGITVIKPTGGAPQRPNIDLAVNFEFNSARLTPDGELILDNLGHALRDPRLDAAHFSIAGHTDAVGSAAYNQTLSERRAEAVRRYLMEKCGVSAARLTAAGFGLTQLLDPGNPTSAINRRVEITNTGP
jgi:OmpA-OmpF porin, OOP family